MAKSETKVKARNKNNYYISNFPPKLLLAARHRAVDEGCAVRDLLLQGLKIVLQKKNKK
jgi:hypothetical protein